MTLRRYLRAAASLAAVAGMAAFGGLVPGAPAHAAPPKPRSEEWWFIAWDIQNKVWQQTRGQGVTVAVVDSGVNASLPELRDVVLPGFDARHGHNGDGRQDVKNFDVGRDFDPNADDSAGHGTGMAALIAGQGGPSGVVGIAPETRILPVVSDGFSMGGGIVWAADHGAQVINISMGASYPGGCPSDVQAAVLHALNEGAVVVASMGNEGNTSNAMLFPASCAGVLGIGAVNNQKLAWTGTQRQSYVSAAAPGVGIGVLTKTGTFDNRFNGTSQASALSSGAVALVRSKFPNLSPREVVQRIINTTVDAGPTGPDNMTGSGVIVPVRALTESVDGSAPNPTFDRLDEWRKENPILATMWDSTIPTPATPTEVSSATPTKREASGSKAFLIVAAAVLGSAAVLLVAGGIVTAVVLTRRRRGPARAPAPGRLQSPVPGHPHVPGYPPGPRPQQEPAQHTSPAGPPSPLRGTTRMGVAAGTRHPDPAPQT